MSLPLSPRRLVALALATCGWLALAPPAAADDGAAYACVPAPPATRLTVTFPPGVSVAELATWLAGFTCEPVIVAPDVAQHATRLQIIAPTPLTPRQAIKLFVNSLEAAGLRVRRKDRTFLVTLGPGMPRSCPDVVVTGADGLATAIGELPLDADALADKLAAGIRRVDATHVELPRALVDEVLANPEAFSRGARVLPSVKGGVVGGFKVYAVRPGGVHARLGLVNGDTVTAIGGVALDSLDRALEAFGSLRGATRVELAVTRRGKPLTLVITITP